MERELWWIILADWGLPFFDPDLVEQNFAPKG
jgi:hypothetical protein